MSTFEKKSVNFSGVDKGKQKALAIDLDLGRGIFFDKQFVLKPEFLQKPCDKLYQGEHGERIVFTRDGLGSKLTGYGALGDTSCGAIDIIVGPHSVTMAELQAKQPTDPDELGNREDEQMYAYASVERDAARIYLSQKTDIDQNFNLAAGQQGNSIGKSAIVMKADDLRFISRQGIKFVTAIPESHEKNSQGGPRDNPYGIDFIAGNDDKDLQPLVKGESLKKCLSKMLKQIQDLNGIVSGFVTYQLQFNAAVMQHTHRSPFYAEPTWWDFETLWPVGTQTIMNLTTKTQASLVLQRQNLIGLRHNYLSQAGPHYINSPYNNTN